MEIEGSEICGEEEGARRNCTLLHHSWVFFFLFLSLSWGVFCHLHMHTITVHSPFTTICTLHMCTRVQNTGCTGRMPGSLRLFLVGIGLAGHIYLLGVASTLSFAIPRHSSSVFLILSSTIPSACMLVSHININTPTSASQSWPFSVFFA